jgi:hypothetical protein
VERRVTTARRVLAVCCASATVLVVHAGVIRFPPEGSHLAEGYRRHPWLLGLDIAVPLVYLLAVLASLWVLQRIAGSFGAPVSIVGLSTWAFTCWFLYALEHPRVSHALREPLWEYYIHRPKEEGFAYTARIATYLQGGFMLSAALGATLGLAIGRSRTEA